jgi:phosphatidylglycerophosphate synthase
LAGWLAARNVSPNLISVLGMVAGLAAGAFLAGTHVTENVLARRVLWLCAAAGIQLRLIANMLDGMVAVASQKASAMGELYNELPDRVSDLTIIIGPGYAVGGSPVAGYVAACAAVLTAYLRAVGKAAGVSNLFLGPMAKPHRMFVLTVASLTAAIFPATWRFHYWHRPTGVIFFALLLIIVGCILTILRRLERIVLVLRGNNL